MKYALLIHETPEAFASRKNGEDDPYLGAWRVFYQAVVEAGIYVGGDPLHLPETATTVRVKAAKTDIQDGPYAEAKEHLAGFMILDLPSLDAALEWAARCPAAAAGAIEVRPLAPEAKQRITCDPT